MKILLHCAKYPSCSVNGALLGSVNASGKVTVTNVIPLLHTCLVLAAPIEVALATVRGGRICGYCLRETLPPTLPS